jgi:hypothetical protein
MYRKESFVTLLIILFIALNGCGNKEDKQEYIDERPTNTSPADTITTRNTKRSEEIKRLGDKIDSLKKLDSDFNRKSDEKSSGEKQSSTLATITPLEAADYNGKEVRVSGFVADVYKTEKVAYLNFIEKYPKNLFSAVIFSSRFSSFTNIDKYEKHTVEVTGRVSMYKGKPQVILDNESQIKIVK